MSCQVFPPSGPLLTLHFLLGMPLLHLCIFSSYPSSLLQIHLCIFSDLMAPPFHSLKTLYHLLQYESFAGTLPVPSPRARLRFVCLYISHNALPRLQIICFCFIGLWASSYLFICINLPYVRSWVDSEKEQVTWPNNVLKGNNNHYPLSPLRVYKEMVVTTS